MRDPTKALLVVALCVLILLALPTLVRALDLLFGVAIILLLFYLLQPIFWPRVRRGKHKRPRR